MQTKPKQNSSKQPAAVQPQARQMPPAEVNPFAPGGAAPQEAQAGAQQTFPVPVDGQMVELTLDELIQAASLGLSKQNAYVRQPCGKRHAERSDLRSVRRGIPGYQT